MFTRHRIQGEPRRNLGDALGTLGHHYKVDHHQYGEDDQAHGEVAADQEVAEGFDHGTGSARSGMAFEQYNSGGGHVQGQTHEGGEKQHGGEGCKVERAHHVGRHHHHHQCNGDVEREEGVQQDGGQWQNHHGQDGDHQKRRRDALNQRSMRSQPFLK